MGRVRTEKRPDAGGVVGRLASGVAHHFTGGNLVVLSNPFLWRGARREPWRARGWSRGGPETRGEAPRAGRPLPRPRKEANDRWVRCQCALRRARRVS